MYVRQMYTFDGFSESSLERAITQATAKANVFLQTVNSIDVVSITAQSIETLIPDQYLGVHHIITVVVSENK